MVRSTFIVVTDDSALVQRAQQFAQSTGSQFQHFTTQQWAEKSSTGGAVPALAFGALPVGDSGKVLAFPTGPFGATTAQAGTNQSTGSNTDGNVQSIDQLEARAIENAIYAFKGNLTEAAKALGIGRATLYRKVKQYNIDPSQARKKRAA